MTYTNKEMQVVMIARQIRDGQRVIVGTGLPLIGASLAKRTYAPRCCLLVESGMVDGRPMEAPTSVADLRFSQGASSLGETFRYFGLQNNTLRKKVIDIGFLGGAQVDPYGNLNSTSIGDYHHPAARFSGSGGANGIATFVDTVLIMQHQRRRFVEKVDYLTSPGWIDGPDGRRSRGLPAHCGPRAVVTDLGVMRFDEGTKRMFVAERYPGVTAEEIQRNTSFDIDVSRAVESRPPEPECLEILRRQLDPDRVYIGKN